MKQEFTSLLNVPDSGLNTPAVTNALAPAIRILHVEDSPDDAFLVERHLRSVGLKTNILRVDTVATLERALKEERWELIFVDCQLPGLDVSEALTIRQRLAADIPVIIITGSIGEEAAVEHMIAGVEDIILKGNWSRLRPAIQRTLDSVKRKREKEEAERELLAGHEKIKRQVEQLSSLRLIDSSIKSSFDLRITLEVILEQVVKRLGVSAAAMLLADPETQILSYQSARGLPASVESKHQKTPIGHTSVLCHEVRVHNLDSNPALAQSHPILRDYPYRAYHAFRLEAKGEIVGMLEVFNAEPLDVNEEWINFLETLVGQAAIAISDASMFERLQQSNMELSAAYDQTIEGWAHALDLRDKETEGHSRRVTEMTTSLAASRGITGRELTLIRWGALLHDIGKMGIPDRILLKPGPLTAEEWHIMKLHPVYARELLQPILFLRGAVDIPYCHHEKWDGSGYPNGLRGEQIPLSARLFAIVDVWDALNSDRPYRPRWPENKIKEHLQNLKGTHFDPSIVDLFLGS